MESTNADSDEWKEYEKKREDWMAIRRQVRKPLCSVLFSTFLHILMLQDDWKFAQWQRNQKRDRKNELEDVREKRRDMWVWLCQGFFLLLILASSIVAKLSELGESPKRIPMAPFSSINV